MSRNDERNRTLIAGLDAREWNIVSGYLYAGAEFGGQRGADDFDFATYVPDIMYRRQIVQAYHTWNGDPEEYRPELVGDYEHAFMLAAFYAREKLTTMTRLLALQAWEFPLIAGLLSHVADSFEWRATAISQEVAGAMRHLATVIWPDIHQVWAKEREEGR